MTIPVLLDTDIGSNIDDALALAYLLRQPRCELLGVTTVTGEPELRAALADALCRDLGDCDIPVHVGADKPLLARQQQPRMTQSDLITPHWPHRNFHARPSAVEFLRETIHESPGEITLLAIGPLTNIALLFSLDPDIPKLLKNLVIMGGQITGWWQGKKLVSETNMRCDPQAASIVFSSLAPITVLGYEVTARCGLDSATGAEWLGGPDIPEYVRHIAERWLRDHDSLPLHDALAAALIFEPSLCALERGAVEVETVSERAAGLTYWTSSDECRHQAAKSVKVDAFHNHTFGVLQGYLT